VLFVGCGIEGAQQNHSEATLYISEHPEVADSRTVPVGPVVTSDSASTLLRSHVHTSSGSVAVQKLVIELHTSASAEDILSDAHLEVSDSKFSVDRVNVVSDSISYLVFSGSAEADMFIVGQQKQDLRLIGKFTKAADGEVAQARITASSLAKTTAVNAESKQQLPRQQKTGSAAGAIRKLKAAGLHVKKRQASAELAKSEMKFSITLELSAFAVGVYVPLRPHWQTYEPPQYRGGGFYFAVESSADRIVTSGNLTRAMLETTSVNHMQQASPAGIVLQEGRQQVVTLSVRFRPPKASGRYCLRAGPVRFTADQEGMFTASDSLQSGCVHMES